MNTSKKMFLISLLLVNTIFVQAKNDVYNPYHLHSGIANNGNTCFFASAIKALDHLPDLAKTILDSNKNTLTLKNYKNYLQSSDPANLINQMRNQWALNRSYRMEDASEFLSQFLISVTEEDLGCDITLRNGKKSKIQKLFNTNKTKSQDNDRDRLLLTLPINGTDLSALLENYQTNSDSPRCAYKYKFLTQPKYMIFHLVRFETTWNRKAKKVVSKKIIDPIPFPMTKFSLDPFMMEETQTDDTYKLVSILVHSGSTPNGGHYYTYCKDQVDQQWRLYNDSSVTPVSEKTIQTIAKTGSLPASCGKSATPYILFYAKQDKQIEVPTLTIQKVVSDPIKIDSQEAKTQDLLNQIDSLNYIIDDNQFDLLTKQEAQIKLFQTNKELNNELEKNTLTTTAPTPPQKIDRQYQEAKTQDLLNKIDSLNFIINNPLYDMNIREEAQIKLILLHEKLDQILEKN